MSFNPKDRWFHKAKAEGFAARSVFKLEEIDKRLKIIRAGDKVLDLGCSPGSWSQYTSKKIGDNGLLIGVDLTEVKLNLPQTTFIQHNVLEPSFLERLNTEFNIQQFDVVLSDMAPKTTGIRITDQARSMELCEMALDISDKLVRPGGNFVCKLFHSSDFAQLKSKILRLFEKFETIKPDSTRKESKEIFLIGMRRK